MNASRKRPVEPALPLSSLRVFARDYPDRHRIERHSHEEAQLLYAASGVMRLTTSRGRWIVPPLRAVWIPARTAHTVDMEGAVAMRTLYFQPGAEIQIPEGCAVIKVRSFLRELILEAVSGGHALDRSARGRLIASLLLIELNQAVTESLFIPLPEDLRLQVICAKLLANPGSGWTLERWGEEVGSSPRTLARLFHEAFGMGFRAWRDQARLAEAVSRLSSGTSVEDAASALGYRSASAFTAMFRRNLGSSPRAYFGEE